MFAGPFTEPDGKTMNGSLIVIEAASLEAARRIAAGDPFAKAGLFAIGRDPPLAVDHQQSRRGGVSRARSIRMAYWLLKSEPDDLVLGPAEDGRRQGRRVGRRAQLPGAQQSCGR